MAVYFAKLQKYLNTKLTRFVRTPHWNVWTRQHKLPVSDVNNKLINHNCPMYSAPYNVLFLEQGIPECIQCTAVAFVTKWTTNHKVTSTNW